MSEEEPQRGGDGDPRIRTAALWFAVIATLLAFGTFVIIVLTVFTKRPDLLAEHFAAIGGVPASGAVAFAIVVFLRQVDGPIRFKGLGFEIEGSAGQALMWILCFLALTGGIKLLWGEH